MFVLLLTYSHFNLRSNYRKMSNGTNPSEYYDGNILTAAINLRGKQWQRMLGSPLPQVKFRTGWMRGQSNLAPLCSKGKVMLGQVVVSLAKECLHSVSGCLCKTGSRTVTLVNTSTQASDSMGSWKVRDMGRGSFSWNINRPMTASLSVLACVWEDVCAVLGFTIAGVLKREKKAVVVLSAS